MREVHGPSVWTDFGLGADEVLARDDHRVYFATSDERAVGCLIASGPEYTMLHALSVLRPHRGLNHATAMLRAAISDTGPGWGQAGMVATVAENDRIGRERFMRLGFRQLPNFVRHGLLVMQRMPPREPIAFEPIEQALKVG